MEHSSFHVNGTNSNYMCRGSSLDTSDHGDPPRRRSDCTGQASSATRLRESAEQTQTSTSRARSFSISQLAAPNGSLFAPLPEYAQYQERKTQRALSRRFVFSETPSSPGFESRQTKIVVTRDLLDVATRQPASPIKEDDGLQRVRGRRLASPYTQEDGVKKREDAMVLEVSPGETAVLRSADETIRAIHTGFVAPVNCFFCTLGMFCIADAKFVLCPKCRVVSPVVARTGTGLSVRKQEGLGLGISRDELVAIKSKKATSASA